MSTNYYFRNKKEYERHKETNKLIAEKNNSIMSEIKTIVNNEDELEYIRWKIECNSYVGYENIHIGKRSCGWMPSFQRQEGLFTSVREMKRFYEDNNDKYDIVDEYGVVFDWDGLKEELLDWKGDRENTHDSYKDEYGYIWHRYEFS